MRSFFWRLLSLLCLTVIPNLSLATTVSNMAYQGVLFDANGTPISDILNLTFRLYNDAESDEALWIETQQVTFEDGIYSVELGSEESLPLEIFSENDSLFLGIQIEGEEESVPRIGLFSAPSAFFCNTAEVAQSLADDVVIASSQIPSGLITADMIAADSIDTDQLADTGVTPGTYGSATSVPQFTVDAKGRLTSITTVTIETSSGTSTGDITAVTPGTGLTGGGIAGDVTLSVDTGTGAGQILQLDDDAKLPAVDGSQLFNLTLTDANIPNDITVNTADTATTAAALATNGSNCSAGSYPLGMDAAGNAEDCTSVSLGDITSVNAGTGLTGGGTTGDTTLSVDTGTSAGQIVQLDDDAKLPAVDGSQLLNLTLANDSLTGDHIVDASLTAADLSASADITDAQIDDALTIAGGSINNTNIGDSTPGTGAFTTLTVGSGTSLSGILTGSATLDFSTASGNCSTDLTITVTGARDGNAVFLGVPNASIASKSQFFAWVSANDTITVRHCSHTSSNNPASGTYNVVVFQ